MGAAATGMRQPPPPPGSEGLLLSQLADDATAALPGAVSVSLPGPLSATRALRARVREAQQALAARAQQGAPRLDPRALSHASGLFEDALVAFDDLRNVGSGPNPVLLIGAISAAQRLTDTLLAAVMGGGGGGGVCGAVGRPSAGGSPAPPATASPAPRAAEAPARCSLAALRPVDGTWRGRDSPRATVSAAVLGVREHHRVLRFQDRGRARPYVHDPRQ